MQKNQKSSRKRIKIFSKNDLVLFWSTNLICFLLILFSLFQFHKDVLYSYEKLDEKPVAVVTERIKTSRRCFGTRTVWDYLQKDSKIYNGDTIRTEENSQVVLHFEDGLVLTLTPKTMTTISVDESKGLQIQLSGGNIIVDSVAKEKAATVVYNKTNISMSGKAMVSAAEIVEKKELEVQVFEGNAEVQSGENRKVVVEDGQMVTVKPVKAEGEAELQTVVADEISDPVSVLEGNPEPVVVLVDVKEDFTASVVDEENIKNVFENHEIIQELETAVIVTDEKQDLKNSSEELIALINDVESKEEAFVKEAAKKKEPAKVQKKTVQKTTVLGAPSIASPANNKVLTDSYFINATGIDFSWATVTGATNYQFILKDPAGKILASKKLGKVNHYMFADLMKLSNGKFEWSVQALKCNSAGTAIEKSDLRKAVFVIKLGEISGDAQDLGEVFGKE